MNQHLLVKIRPLGMPHRCVANLGNSRAKAGPMSKAIALGLTRDWRLDSDRSGAPGPALRYFNKQMLIHELIRGSLGEGVRFVRELTAFDFLDVAADSALDARLPLHEILGKLRLLSCSDIENVV
jgi:hypothetical protein